MFGDESCEMCDCIEFNGPTPSKFTPNGSGGGTFVPVDPRTEGTVPPPWPPDKVPEGQTGNCLAAANIVAIWKHTNDNTINLLAIDASLLTLLAAFVEFLSLFAPVVGELADLALALAGGALGAGITLYTTTFQGIHSADMYAALQCILDCNAASDGSFTADEIPVIKLQFEAWVNASPLVTEERLLAIGQWETTLDALGPNGLNTWGHLGGVTSADCSSCDCGWMHKFDFALGMEGWEVLDNGYALNAVYTGHSWTDDATIADHAFYIQRVFPANRDLTSASIDFETNVNPGSNFMGFTHVPHDGTGYEGFNPDWGGIYTRQIRNFPVVYTDAGWCAIEWHGADQSIEVFSITFRGTGTDPF